MQTGTCAQTFFTKAWQPRKFSFLQSSYSSSVQFSRRWQSPELSKIWVVWHWQVPALQNAPAPPHKSQVVKINLNILYTVTTWPQRPYSLIYCCQETSNISNHWLLWQPDRKIFARNWDAINVFGVELETKRTGTRVDFSSSRVRKLA